MTEKIILTGDRPTGRLHVGHYVGSLKRRVELQNSGMFDKIFIMIADAQALTDNADNPAKVRDNIMEVALDYLSVGIDPAKSHIFIQSYVTELTELTFYYQNLVTVSRLQRNPTVKAEIQMRNFEASIPVGFFNYPISQAADITAFHATTVPVGEDQMPMLEQTKEIVHKFNAVYGETLTDPQILLPDNKACLRLPGTDGKAKMSKSLGNCIYLSESEADVKKKIMSMFTDPDHIRIEDPGKLEGNTVFTYLDAFCTDGHFAEYLPEYANLDELKAHYKRGGLGDVKVKKFLNNVMQEELSPIRARIDMSSSNINMRDPVIYRVAHMTHHRTGDKWCIYPMYDFAHPLEDAIEGITHSICTLEFEDHRPLYEWVINEVGAQIIPDKDEMPPRQIEFAKLYLTNVVTGKRYIKRLVEEGIVDGWDDPRLVSIAALRRRGFTPESLKMFVELCGISKANSSVDYAMLEYCIREDLKMKKSRMMAVLDPVKVVIDNYPEGQTEYLDVVNNLENEALGVRKIPFSGELYIEREDFMEEPPKKYFRMFPGNEVRLMNAYFVTCNSFEKDENGNVTVIHCTYDPASRGGNSPDGRKVKGTIHWVSAAHAVSATVRLYENIVDEEKGVYNEDGSLNLNPNSLTVLKNCMVEENLAGAKAYDSFQFVRQGFFCVDAKDSTQEQLVFNRIVSLKSSFKLPTA